MKFETIIIGAGLAGLTAAIRLVEEGKKVALISAGQSALHFNSGSFGLLGFVGEQQRVASPIEAATLLPEVHPYTKLGNSSLINLTSDAKELLQRAGIKTFGSSNENHLRLSPLGILRPAWLTLEHLVTIDALKNHSRVAIIGLAGFLDFYPRFIAAGLEKEGISCDLLTIDTPDLRNLRASETEMRAVNIARVLDGAALDRFIESLANATKTSEATAIILPAVIYFNDDTVRRLRSAVGRDVFFAPTMGISAPGVAMHKALTQRFLALGGKILNGHKVTRGEFEGDKLSAVYTDKLDDDPLRAENFIFAGGSFFSRGIIANPDNVIEPVLWLDTVAPADRTAWFESDLFGNQPIMNAGIDTDAFFHAKKSDKCLTNLYVIGSSLADADSLRNDSGAGVAMLSALAVADKIINQR